MPGSWSMRLRRQLPPRPPTQGASLHHHPTLPPTPAPSRPWLSKPWTALTGCSTPAAGRVQSACSRATPGRCPSPRNDGSWSQRPTLTPGPPSIPPPWASRILSSSSSQTAASAVATSDGAAAAAAGAPATAAGAAATAAGAAVAALSVAPQTASPAHTRGPVPTGAADFAAPAPRPTRGGRAPRATPAARGGRGGFPGRNLAIHRCWHHR